MVRVRWLLASLLFALPLSGCIGDAPDPTASVPTKASGTFAKGDHLAITFEGTGWFLGTWQATEHLNVKFSLAHDAVDDWCRSSRTPDPVHVGGAFTAVAAFRADTAPRETGASFARIGESAAQQRTSHLKMLGGDECHVSQAFVVLPGQALSLVVATSVPGLRVSLFELRADGPTQNLTVPLAAQPGLVAWQPTSTKSGGPDLGVARALHKTEWRETIDVDGQWLLGLLWRDVTPVVPNPLGFSGHGHFRHWFRLLPVDASSDHANPTAGAGMTGGGAGPTAWLAQIVAQDQGERALVLDITETGYGTTDHKEGAWFVAIPYRAAE